MFTWGANSHGQLGTGDKIDRLEPELFSHSRCTLITGGGGHSSYFDGCDVYTCGNNSTGQLGRSGTQLNFERVVGRFDSPVAQLASGWDFSFVLTKRGSLYSIGSNAFGQLCLPDLESTQTPVLVNSSTFAYISAGLRHAVAITTNGTVLSWGSNRRCQLGNFLSKGFRNCEAVRVSHDALSAAPVACVAGAYHSTLLTANGTILLIGDLSYFQRPDVCGIIAEPSPYLWLHRNSFGGRPVVQIASGWSHIVARTDTGDVYTWGRSDLGQLGRTVFSHPPLERLSTPQFDPVPMRVSFSDVDDMNVKIVDIAAGSEHNLAIDTEGNLWTWGWNEHGMCGVKQPKFIEGDSSENDCKSSTASVRTPCRLSLPSINSSEGLIPPKVHVIGAGFGHSFASVS